MSRISRRDFLQTITATALLSGRIGRAVADTVPIAETRPHDDRVWVGPQAFKSSRVLRDDYYPILTNPGAWPFVRSRANVFKSYIMILPAVPVPGKTAPELSDEQLAHLAAFMQDHGLKVAFEVGGLRRRDGEKPKRGEWGKRVAANEFTHLKRWLGAGGRIHYLTTDHAVMMNLGHHCYLGDDCGMTIEETLSELGDYFVEMKQRIPGVRFGVIESLGYFHVNSPTGEEYPRTVAKLPVWHFEHYFEQVLTAMRQHNLELDHFHIDFGFGGVQSDGRRTKRGPLDYGRVLGVEACVHSHGVKSGVIVNAFHDRTVPNPTSAVASKQAYERTLEFFTGYAAAGGHSEQLLLQTWQPFPDKTGPEDEPYTVLNIARDVMRRPEFPRIIGG